jgi:hypothetical protein
VVPAVQTLLQSAPAESSTRLQHARAGAKLDSANQKKISS